MKIEYCGQLRFLLCILGIHPNYTDVYIISEREREREREMFNTVHCGDLAKGKLHSAFHR